MSNTNYTQTTKEIKRDAREKFTATLSGIEFAVESMNETLGKIIASSTPILSGVGSAFAIGFATYQGMFGITDSHRLSLSAAMFIAATVEGINFSGILARDRVESYNRRTSNPADHLPRPTAESLAYWTFIITLTIVAAFESIPGAYRWYTGEIVAEEALFRIALITLPFLSRIGAQIYSLTSLINAVDTSDSDREMRDLEDELKRKKLVDKYNREKAEADAKLSNKIEKLSDGKQNRTTDKRQNTGVTTVSDSRQSDNLSDMSSDNRRQHILDILTEHISIGASEIHRLIGGDETCKRSTLYEDLNALADDGLIYNADRKWHIKPISANPEPIEFSTNGVAHA